MENKSHLPLCILVFRRIIFCGIIGINALYAEPERSCQINAYETSEELKNLWKEFSFLKEPSEKSSLAWDVRADKLFNTLIQNIGHGDVTKFLEKLIKLSPEAKENINVATFPADIEKFFINYYKKILNFPTPSAVTQDRKNKSELEKEKEQIEKKNLNIEAFINYNKILAILYRVASDASSHSYSNTSIFQTSYILNTALRILHNAINPAPLLQYFLETMLNQTDIRVLIKKVVAMPFSEYQNNAQIINNNLVAQHLKCMKKFQLLREQIQEEEDEKLPEGDAPTPEPAKVMEVLFLEGIKKAPLSAAGRKKLIRYLKNKEYKKDIQDKTWLENEPLIKKIIQILDASKSKYDREDYHRSYDSSTSRYRDRGASPISGGHGSRENSRISLQGAGILGFSAESSAKDVDSEEAQKKEEAPKMAITFWERRHPKKSKINAFLQMREKLKNSQQSQKKEE
ncbi:hypothetical protein [Holospora curviuscula]|uniref:Uncharacterized protein n=1 Tax=Holospora curviuscula TaxID=1082868 RepID=A0A2S5R7K1_9PROT|nr:hypothetical protein [Holospora curviuscula]PPE03280.1 hypothetical protein HCUR_01274 [Holospora curviuscula]